MPVGYSFEFQVDLIIAVLTVTNVVRIWTIQGEVPDAVQVEADADAAQEEYEADNLENLLPLPGQPLPDVDAEEQEEEELLLGDEGEEEDDDDEELLLQQAAVWRDAVAQRMWDDYQGYIADNNL